MKRAIAFVFLLISLSVYAGSWIFIGTSGHPTDPTNGAVAGIQLWLRPDHITGLSDTDPVSTFPDFSPFGSNATSSGTARPQWRSNQLNGRSAIQSDGSNDTMTGTLNQQLNSWHAYVVVRISAFRQFDSFIGSSGTNSAVFEQASTGGANGDLDVWVVNVGARASATGGPLAQNTWAILCYAYDGTTLKIYVNNVERGSQNQASVRISTSYGILSVAGFFSPTGLFGDFAIYTFLGFASANQKTVYNAIATYYGLPTIP